MAVRGKVSPFSVRGGFRGVNTSMSPRELRPQEAVVAENILFRDGAITPRPPFVKEDLHDAFENVLDQFPIYTGVDFLSNDATEGKSLRIVHAGDRLYDPGGGIGGVNRRQGTFIPALGRLYYVDGKQGFVRSGAGGGIGNWTILGIPEPTAQQIVGTPRPIDTYFPQAGQILWYTKNLTGVYPGALTPGHKYRFLFSYYSERTDTESNAVQSPPEGENPHKVPNYDPTVASRILHVAWGDLPTNRGISHIRVYVRDETAGAPPFLYFQIPVGNQPAPLLTAFVGNPEVGPFSPVKNGVPARASVGLYYKGRMLFNDLDNPTLLRFSADSHPGHLDPLDYLQLDDGGGQITGMAELAGQAVILKERSIWILSGVIIAPTNASIALGASVVPSAHDLYRPSARVGCANAAGGNGAIVCGQPARLYYNGADGLYAFDGPQGVAVGDHVQALWETFLYFTLGRNQAVTYFVSPRLRTLFMVNTPINPFQGVRPPILAYNYENGAWSTITLDEPEDVQANCLIPLMGENILGPFTDPTYESQETAPALLAVGAVRFIQRAPGLPKDADPFATVMTEYYSRPGYSNPPMPNFLYRSGRMVVVDGLDAHFYAVKWLHGEAGGGAFQHGLLVGYRTHSHGQEERKALDLTDGLRSYQTVSETGSDIELLIANDPAIDARWSRDVRIVGFEIDAEVVGQR